MNQKSKDTSEMENLREYPYPTYVRGGVTDYMPAEKCYILRDNKQNATIHLRDNYDKEQSRCNGFKAINQVTIPPTRRNIANELDPCTRASIESMRLPYLHTERKSVHSLDKSNKETKSNFSHQIYGNHSTLTFTKNSEQVYEKIPVNEKLCDKTTYCRPVLNLYNQEFLYKTMAKNAKLQRLVTELINARKKEKEIENWNNYINELKRKHNRDPNVKLPRSLQHISGKIQTHDTIEDIYNTKFTCKQSDPCRNLLQELYDPRNIDGLHCDKPRILHESVKKTGTYIPFITNPLCFPTSSQGRNIMLERERNKRLMNRGHRPVHYTICKEKKVESESPKIINRKGLECGTKTSFYTYANARSTNTSECATTQTDFKDNVSLNTTNVLQSIGCNTCSDGNEKKNINGLQNKDTGLQIINDESDVKKSLLVGIEEKLDDLIHSINNFISEMKTKCVNHKNFNQYTKLGKRNVNYTRSDICNMTRKENNVSGFVDDSSRTTRNSSIDTINRINTIDENLFKINEILRKGLAKNQLITLERSTVGERYHPCSVQISVTIPTKEMSTEVTRSLSQGAGNDHRKIIIEEIPKSGNSRITIAVNTDPLSLLTMLKVSTEEAIRRVLSYMPTIDYYSYLCRLQGSTPVIDSQFVCNICGAAFSKASALTDHIIQKHDLGNTRNCCVCRHVLDSPRRRPGLFKCQYCGQRFTRAYCCELHQEACARRLGRLHDVPSSLMLLR